MARALIRSGCTLIWPEAGERTVLIYLCSDSVRRYVVAPSMRSRFIIRLFVAEVGQIKVTNGRKRS